MRIDGAVALVTGANRGLGSAIAARLVARGARAYGGSRRPSEPTAPGVTPVPLDITDPAGVAAAAERCGDVTLLVNNAAVASPGALLTGPADLARREMETNYLGTLAMCRAFAPVLARNGGGALVNMLSITSFFSFPGLGSLSATKAAAWSMTHGVRAELRAQGTLVVGVHASAIDTRLAEGFDMPKHQPEEVADLILDAVEAGHEEVLADERTRWAKRSLPRDLELVYPTLNSELRP
ncbi:SDR family oxidoreductase [Pseudonocardia cypriaca]|uniref:NADP-dependent 3-hydroxy acid dehydrogenase YdfG n=1 Tax=Pseudonocardia cypriaca TaxID=882449 RepID=A0A543GHK8_9PSEU|nr:SDR family oxidoreductase [Pseudonocardia cypriaca]TQM45560.1 NADP-dependent 3-hydroxy acid dehydrogenase YdfG [Pseudonocardia cypriaca]